MAIFHQKTSTSYDVSIDFFKKYLDLICLFDFIYCLLPSVFCISYTYSFLKKFRFGAKWENNEWIICKSEFPLITLRGFPSQNSDMKVVFHTLIDKSEKNMIW